MKKSMNKKLPDYIVINDENIPSAIKKVLTNTAKPYRFPLSDQDRKEIAQLEQKYDQEKNCAGLAGPQIGIPKQVFVFAVEFDEEIKRRRPDFEQTMPKSIWLNPTYEPIGEATHVDYEACFSVKDLYGMVKRYKEIKYTAYDLDGNKIEGTATGFLARVIQHETDHVHGTLYIDLVPEDQLIKPE